MPTQPQLKLESTLLAKFKEILASDSPAHWATLSPDEKQLFEQYKLQVGHAVNPRHGPGIDPALSVARG
jgi:hypothetical protein